jgi:hypothetical protein
MKAIIVTDFAYKGSTRKGRGTGKKGLRSTLKYLQYRDNARDHIAQDGTVERWVDCGLGQHYREIFDRCDALQSKHVLAWTWVVSPAPDVIVLVPARERCALVCELTERLVEDYYAARGLETPEYSYVLHDRQGTDADGEPMQHLHTHVVLAGTVPSVDGERVAVYNNKERGHDRLFREIGTRHFEQALDARGIDWRRLREPEPEADIDLDRWFS